MSSFSEKNLKASSSKLGLNPFGMAISGLFLWILSRNFLTFFVAKAATFFLSKKTPPAPKITLQTVSMSEKNLEKSIVQNVDSNSEPALEENLSKSSPDPEKPSKLPKFLQIYVHSFQAMGEDKVPTLAAALSYYAIFSLAPLLLVLIFVLDLVLGDNTAKDQILSQISATAGESAGEVVNQLISNTRVSTNGWVASLIAVGSLVLGATGLFEQVRQSFNQIWGEVEKKEEGFKAVLKSKVISFLAILFLSMMFFGILITSSITSVVISLLQLNGFWLEIGNQGIFVLATTILFACLYKMLVESPTPWKPLFFGALSSSILFTLAKFLLGLYFANSNLASLYNSSSSLVLLLLWIYYSAQIVFFGLEVAKFWHKENPRKITQNS